MAGSESAFLIVGGGVKCFNHESQVFHWCTSRGEVVPCYAASSGHCRLNFSEDKATARSVRRSLKVR